jgi:dTDP-6-deoxy-L-talose 4-dehydrogenase (NAD+)
MIKKNNIVVTGASGFVGGHLIKELKKKCNLILTYNKKKIKDDKNYRVIKLDLNKKDYSKIIKLKKINTLIHLAWDNLNNFQSNIHIKKNLDKNKNFIKTMIDIGCENIIITGTCYEYGLQEGRLTEKLNSKPIVNYAIAKNKLRKYLEELKKKNKFKLSWLRIFFIYGLNKRRDTLTNLLIKSKKNKKKIYINNVIKRDYLGVEKVAKIIAKISLKNKDYGIVNICSGKAIDMKNFVSKVKNKYKINPSVSFVATPQRSYEPENFYGCNKKLNKILRDN